MSDSLRLRVPPAMEPVASAWQDAAFGRIARRSGAPELDDHASVVLVAGAFDGLHLGHQRLVAQALADSCKKRVPCVALTFDPDPSEVISPASCGNRLLSTHDRVRGLIGLGVDYVLVCTFTPELAGFEPNRFLDEVVLGAVRPLSVHVGTNFTFGNRGAGTVQTLRAAGSTRGFDVFGHELLRDDADVVSSTRIRALLSGGDVASAADLLGNYHYVRGTVVHGRGEATSFGFPTANVTCDARACLPAEGVYACYVYHDGAAWPAAANVGAPPTFSGPRAAFLEANLLGFYGDLYDQDVAVLFVEWLRPSRTFESIDELERTVLGNIAWVKRHLGDKRIEVRS
ncbi:MAG: riboflavin biosynthesis protein RibF [Atopobiaceae bacterium]|nr:riboflavin biosynthesis protein RibF [Atopobiaceae bacterium]